MKKIFLLIFIIIVFAIGVLIGINIKSEQSSFKISHLKGNFLTNPLLDCEIYEKSPYTKANLLRNNVNNVIEDYSGNINELSVFYRDLNNGPSFGINENNKFAPASLLKVPLMIAYLKKAEQNPETLSKKIKYEGEHYLNENLPDTDTLTPGESYSIDNLIYRMISLSDNLAFETLLKNIEPDWVKKVHKDLDLVYPDNNTPNDYITVKSYAGLFRVLYNATYLNREMSEKALQYLTKSDFHLGIQAGIPKNITIALKFGIRDSETDNLKQIHDCGIIYAPKKPYLLCIMTKGTNNKTLIEIIKNISKTIYDNDFNN